MENRTCKPLRTYAHRRSRAKAACRDDARSSSPLEPVPPGTENMSLLEMTRRMQKRSRQTTASADGGEDDGTSQQNKRTKRSPQVGPLDHKPSDCPPCFFVPEETMQYCTPRPVLPSEKPMQPSSTAKIFPAEPEFSPLPVVKSMLSHTSSRILKENKHRLASPFHSRPNSRPASPMHQSRKQVQGKAQRPPFHSKSRTLSTALDPWTLRQEQKPITDVNATMTTTMSTNSNEAFSTASSSRHKQASAAHIRTGSIPAMPTTRNPESMTWLVHSKQFEQTMHSAVEAEHPSFFLDAPIQISTPPRRRRATTDPVRMQGNDSDAELERDWKTGKDANMHDESRPSSPNAPIVGGSPQPRRRRRTINHPTTNGLFSTVLDFSASVREDKRSASVLGVRDEKLPDKFVDHAEAHGTSRLTAAFSGLNLESAFSPITPHKSAASGDTAPHASSTLPLEPSLPLSQHLTGDRSLTNEENFDRSRDELRNLFSGLELDGAHISGPQLLFRAYTYELRRLRDYMR
ncbi:uncharacterized protein LAESUDRAFT_462677 [Laetiporus sulphureus 93-53]|uniref:Uncharacterized protein n=1 Tax=Laetiporus sulphureus 93-53 TaxID=1314785 RepID=A0A165G5G5_9APHY|nr:uncharacterized protein LAESUDRAFT_462677 [Laetiporus sulphureus 93-53]KZT09853.1 hypothetical protein LAESUDRAFT_462677 [Laetiporus sulphureus 93-53]